MIQDMRKTFKTTLFIILFNLLLPAAISGQEHTLTLTDAIEIAQHKSYNAMVA